jgi:CRISPR/Cas system-associated protein Csm6
MAEVGTEIRVRFFALDNTDPADLDLSAQVFRTITIVDPCGSGQEFCDDDRTCSDIACDRRAEFLGSDAEDRAPVVQLVVRDPNQCCNTLMTMFTKYDRVLTTRPSK